VFSGGVEGGAVDGTVSGGVSGAEAVDGVLKTPEKLCFMGKPCSVARPPLLESPPTNALPSNPKYPADEEGVCGAMLFHRQTTMVALHRKTRDVYGIEKYQ
jgi:hypothetical protein